MVTEEKKKKAFTSWGQGGYWLESGMKELSGMMEVFYIFIQMHAAYVCVCVCVCVCDWAVYLRFVHFTECKLYQKKKKTQTMNNTEWEICGSLTKEHLLLISSRKQTE